MSTFDLWGDQLANCRFATLWLASGLRRGDASADALRPRQAVRGTVTIGGIPLPFGLISFSPENTAGSAAPEPVVVASIRGGVYSFDADSGPEVGWHVVSIESVCQSCDCRGQRAGNGDVPAACAAVGLPRRLTLRAFVAAEHHQHDFSVTPPPAVSAGG